MRELPELCPPPSYDYRSVGPWLVGHEGENGKVKAWTLHAAESAMRRFWGLADGDPYPVRRVCVDARGITVLGTSHKPDATPVMVGTREFMEATLAKLERDPNASLEERLSVVQMAETLREMNGAAV